MKAQHLFLLAAIVWGTVHFAAPVFAEASEAGGVHISRVSPSTVAVGDTMNIYGTGFGSTVGTAYLTWCGTDTTTQHPLTVLSWTNTAILVRIPSSYMINARCGLGVRIDATHYADAHDPFFTVTSTGNTSGSSSSGSSSSGNTSSGSSSGSSSSSSSSSSGSAVTPNYQAPAQPSSSTSSLQSTGMSVLVVALVLGGIPLLLSWWGMRSLRK